MSLETRDAFLERVDPIIVKQAHKQLKGSEILEVDDIIQAVRLKFIEEYQHVKGLDDNSLSYVAYRAAATFCEKERTDYMYASGNFTYFGELVERLLREHVFTDLDGDTDIEGRVDVQTALDHLSVERRRAIVKHYQYGEKLTDAERKQRDRALRQVTDFLNRGALRSRVDMHAATEEI